MPDEGEAEIDFDGSKESAIEIAKLLGWEGFVVLDPDGTYGDKAVSFRGKADRPKHAVKVKPKLEADFCVRWDPERGMGTWGKGKKAKGVGSVAAFLWDPGTEGWRYVSKVGGGLTEANVKGFANTTLYPMVWQVEFASWTDKGSVQFPEFIRVREDKTPKECTTEQLPEELR